MQVETVGNLKKVELQAVGLVDDGRVSLGVLETGAMLPLVVTPQRAGVDVSLWVQEHREWVEAQVLKFGGVLFRGFAVETQEAFNEFVSDNCSELLNYKEGATPRTKLTGKVYTSTEFPAEHTIALHNELSYVTTWPKKIWFGSIVPALEGGETPIADVRRVYDRIDPAIRSKFEEKGWMLVRNYGNGFGLPWEAVFHVDSEAEVEAYCHENAMECEWLGGPLLRTRQVRPAVIAHPDTGEMLWFNHIAFWHESSLEPMIREVFQEEFGAEGMPYNTFYGDGTPIEDEVVEALRAAYDAETIAFPWQRGDLLMLDNMLVAHGRSPYKGDRKTIVAMGEPITRTDL
ncbi:MAG: TauD/TfdA family dioxygenase [Tumebacillaceae bacterium]